MHKIIIEKECGCFKRSSFENNQVLESKDDAMMTSIGMVKKMNDDFCGKHNFKLIEVENDFVIAMADSTTGGCCGGGCSTH
jgi:hypothetical protein